MQCRDWLTTLWHASYRGFQFFFESDDEKGGRGLVIHEFPHRDHPFVEDLGESPRFYEGAAYVHGDSADALAQQFAQTLASRGPAILVTPVGGPVLVHCQTFERHHERDKLGFVAFRVRFVRAGAASAVISIPMLSHAAFAAAQAAASAIARNFAANVAITGVAEHIRDAAIDGVAVGAAALDAVRDTDPVDPVESARLRQLATAIIAAARPVLSSDPDAAGHAAAAAAFARIDADDDPVVTLAGAIVAQARGLADAMPVESALRAMDRIAEAFPFAARGAPYLSPSVKAAAGNAAAAARLVRLAAMVAYAETVIRKTFRDRTEGVNARAEIAARFEQELLNTTGADHVDLYRALVEVQGRAIDYLSRVINDLAPVIEIEAARTMPSLFWSWRLYGVADRGGEIVARNAVRHPSFIPMRFAALAR